MSSSQPIARRVPPSPPHPPLNSFAPFYIPPRTASTITASRPRPPHLKPKIPTPLTPQELPAKYRGAERKVRTAIVALPIAIVTSWVLYDRVVNGKEQKHFDREVEKLEK